MIPSPSLRVIRPRRPNFPDADARIAGFSKPDMRRAWQANDFKVRQEKHRMNIPLRPVALAVGRMALPFAVFTHFELLEPAEWVKSDLGDPQKAGPCGLPDTNGDNARFLTNASSKVTGGSKLHLKIQETVFHAGHYRVALAVNSRNDLPPDPVAAERWTDKGPYSVWAQIQSPPQIPVLFDGLFQHYVKPGEPSSRRVDPKSPLNPGD